MVHIAKLFSNGGSQAVRLPAAYRFDGVSEVYIRQDPATGDLILSRRPQDWSGFIEALADTPVPDDFLMERQTDPAAVRDPLSGWRE
ncbi:AbrB/MazE/SpoVT family DNA-binding domain-containing protein [Niveispirillum sp. SYP-B3756]|uniref:antitoxin n=1 Tax=Niveispirillum sp. SYP-B3756 TaxID=2662178 RepID=UPI0012914DCE|nr:AbrB/MazE/SpoVT family DNA-binding domain-containing protein [Niveispirillum sp. SYP-B3756]MQP63767.1 AbrB/MazE/SpoVT family DNA-binding domain-containing protein [Niveispirillum sp. SYP-B3756]